MKQNYDFLPHRLTKEEIALSPANWVRVLSHYSYRRRRALWEKKPGYNTLLAAVMAAIAKKDRHLLDIATELTRKNMPKYVYLSLVSSALRCLEAKKEEGLMMIREAAKLDQSPSTLLSLAAETDDLDEKESLAKRVLDENPKNSEALRQLAYARYFKGEHEEAEGLVDEILLNELGNIYAREFKGNIYFDKKEYQKALEQYLKIDLKPVPVSLQLKICHCYHLIGKVGKAKRIARKIKDKIPYAYDIECGIERANEILAEILNS
jgi:tetratricopeptide (TPR) repeat protein